MKKYFNSFFEKILIFDLNKLIKILISTFIMIVLILLIKKIINLNIYFDLIIQILIGLIIYFLLLNWLKLSELKLIFQLKKFN